MVVCHLTVVGSFLGDSKAFSAFYRANAGSVLVFFARRTLDPQAALDLTSETFAQAFGSRRSFRGATDAEAAGWLFAIARRQLARYFEAGQAESKLSDRLHGGRVVAGDEDLDRIEELASLGQTREALKQRLLDLDRGQVDALWLRVVEEQPYQVIANRLGISEQAARARVSRGLRAMSESLAAAGEMT